MPAPTLFWRRRYRNNMIIIPDIHGREFWERPVKENIGKEHIVFLGDYLDPYEHEGVAQWEVYPRFEDIISLKKENPGSVTLLLGNHDLHYVNEDLIGGRFDHYHAARNRNAIVDNAGLFQLTYEAVLAGRKYLFTHAGILRGWIDENRKYFAGREPEDIATLLNEYWMSRIYWPRLFTILNDVPYARLGSSRWGSPIWSDVIDFDDSFYEIADTYQIFCHTQQEFAPIIAKHFACLDCRKAFLLNDQGEITEIKNRIQ